MKTILFLVYILFSLISCTSSRSTEKASKAEILFEMGNNFLREEEFSEALAQYLQALALTPDDFKIHNHIGMTYLFKKDYVRARKSFEKAIELNGKYYDALNNLAGLYLIEGKLKKAQRIYTDLTRVVEYPHQYRVYYNLGIIGLRRSEFSRARKFFEMSISENKKYCPAYYQRANIFFRSGEYKAAYGSYKKALLGTCYTAVAPHYFKALSLLKMNKFKEAANGFSYVVKKFPKEKFAGLAKEKLKHLQSFVTNPEEAVNTKIIK